MSNTLMKFSPYAQGYSELCHAFAYSSPNDSGTTRCGNMSFEGDIVWSYSTIIAKRIRDTLSGENVVLITENRYSNTTAKQKRILKDALSHYHFIELPSSSDYGWTSSRGHLLNINETISEYNKRLEYYSENLNIKAHRMIFIHIYQQLEMINRHLQQTNTHHIFEALNYQILNNDLKTIKEHEKQKAAKFKLELKELLNTYNMAELADRAYSGFYGDNEYRAKLRKIINPKNEFSFVWFHNQALISSQNIHLERKLIEPFLKLWNKGKLKHGMQIAHYTVLEVMPLYVRVGCHKIPTENLQALCNQLNTKVVA